MVEFTYQMVLGTLQTVGLLVGIYYYIMTIRANQRNQEIALKNQELTLETRQAQLYEHLSDLTWSRETQEALDIIWPLKHLSDEEFIEKFRDDWKFRRAFFHWAYLMERVGSLLKRGLIDVEPIAISGSTARTIIDEWEDYRSVIYKLRQTDTISKRSFNMWEYLYDTLMKYFEEHPELLP